MNTLFVSTLVEETNSSRQYRRIIDPGAGPQFSIRSIMAALYNCEDLADRGLVQFITCWLLAVQEYKSTSDEY